MTAEIKKQKGLEQRPMSVRPSGAQTLSLMEQYYDVGLRYCFVKNEPVFLKKEKKRKEKMNNITVMGCIRG